MKFSIRELLALAAIAALGMVAWQSRQEAREGQVRLAGLLNQIQAEEGKLRLDDPELRQAIEAPLDQHATLAAARDRSQRHLAELINKYSSVEARGDQTLSLRSIPSIGSDTGRAPVRFRLINPTRRDVWIKFGVHTTVQNRLGSRRPEADDDLLSESPFDHDGPYQLRLPPGNPTLTVAMSNATDGVLPFRIEINGEVLLDSAFRSPDVTGCGWSAIAAKEQIDYGPKRTLPSLTTVNMYTRDESGNRKPQSFGFSVWLSETPSDYEPFPSE